MSTGPSETVTGYVVPPVPGTANAGVTAVVMARPTQVRRPWRSTVRTAVQVAIGLASLLPFVAAGIYDDPADYPAVVGQVLAVVAVATRVMALPQVEKFLQDWGIVSWLAAAPSAITSKEG